jgi:hypothetical protein
MWPLTRSMPPVLCSPRQFLGNLFEYFLSKRKGADARLTILGATSGDTGACVVSSYVLL